MKPLRVAVLWGIGLLLLPALAGAQSAEDWYRQGFEHSLQENSGAAIQAYRNALDRRPDWAEAHHALATLLFRSGQGPQAIAQFRMAEREYARRQDAQAVTNLGIVHRNLKQAYRELGLDPQDFEQIESIPGLPAAPPWRISGTGFLAGAHGTVLTSNHAVKDAHQIRIRLADGSTHPARLNRSFNVYDVAVLEMQPSGPLSLKRLSLGDSSLVKEGEPVYVLKDLQSADSRKGNLLAVNALESNKIIFHVGSPAGPKDSGGPVFNHQGEVVGLLLTRKDIQNLFRRMKPVPENTSFAIKSDYLRQTLKRVSRSAETSPSGLPASGSLPRLTEVIASGTVTVEVSP